MSVSWTVANLGSETAAAFWSDDVYLSTDQTLSSDDIYLDSSAGNNGFPLAPGLDYTVTRDLVAPNVAAGSYFLIFTTNRFDSQYETDPNNNTLTAAITLTTPDVNLTVINVSSPASAVIKNGGGSVSVSYTVKNEGGDPAAGGWHNAVYLSDDPTLDDDDQSLSFNFRSAQLAAGGQFNVSANLFWSSDATPGNQYLLFVADAFDNRSETRKDDNVVAAPITLSFADANLTVTNATAPATAVVGNGAQIAVSMTVKNLGSERAAAFRTDAVYLSEDPTFDFNDVMLTTFSSSPLAADAQRTRSATVGVSNVAAGAWHLLFVTDVYNDQGETDESTNSNVLALPISLTAPDVDLEITDVIAPATANEGSTINLSWTVENLGSATALTDWYDYLYLSPYPYYDPSLYSSNRYLTSVSAASRTPLAGGAGYTLSVDVFVPDVTPGDYFLLVVVDGDNEQSETDETNQTFVAPITLTAPDLIVTQVTAPSAVILGDTVEISWTSMNQGATPAPSQWHDAVYFSDDEFYDDDDTFIGSIDASAHVPLAPGASYTLTESFLLPQTAVGNRYLVVRANAFGGGGEGGGSDSQGETDFTNNDLAVPIDIAAPDLEMTFGDAPVTPTAGETLAISYTVTNVGAVTALTGWSDRIYLSKNPFFDGIDDTQIGSFFTTSGQSPLAAGADYTASRNVVLPGTTAPGDYHLLFVANANQDQGETTRHNNVYSLLITVFSPDLVVVDATAPAQAVLGEQIATSYSVENQSNVQSAGRLV